MELLPLLSASRLCTVWHETRLHIEAAGFDHVTICRNVGTSGVKLTQNISVSGVRKAPLISLLCYLDCHRRNSSIAVLTPVERVTAACHK